MLLQSPLHEVARTLFEQECQRLVENGDGTEGVDFSPAFWIMSELVDQVACGPNRSMEEWERIIRRRAIEQDYLLESGDAVVDPHYRLPLDMEVHLITAVLNHLRAGTSVREHTTAP